MRRTPPPRRKRAQGEEASRRMTAAATTSTAPKLGHHRKNAWNVMNLTGSQSRLARNSPCLPRIVP
eukprot:7221190-Pyramimonas_sp.AAC.2